MAIIVYLSSQITYLGASTSRQSLTGLVSYQGKWRGGWIIAQLRRVCTCGMDGEKGVVGRGWVTRAVLSL